MNEEPKKSRGRRGEGSIHWDQARGRYVGAVSLGTNALGQRVRPKVYGATKAEVRAEMRRLRDEHNAGVRTPARMTLNEAVNAWLEAPAKKRSEKTTELYRLLAGKHIAPTVGKRRVRDLTADDLDFWLADRAQHIATSTVQRLHWIVKKSLQHLQRRGALLRNVAEHVDPPDGRPGRPSKALAPEQATALLKAARGYALYPYIAVSLSLGLRPEEARSLRWEQVDLSGVPDADPPRPPSIWIWRSDRVGGAPKTASSWRRIALPELALHALQEHRERQQARGFADEGSLVFCTSTGGPYSHHHVIKLFQPIARRAGLSGWSPRELRHSFVSLMSADGVALEEIARIVGHATTLTTQTHYRRELRPVITEGADRMDSILGNPQPEEG